MRRLLDLARAHPRDAALVGALAASLAFFSCYTLPKIDWATRPALQTVRTGFDYEAARLRGRPGYMDPEDHAIVKGVDRLLPDGTRSVALGTWNFQRHCRYYLYPRLIINHGYAAGPTFEEAWRRSGADAVIVKKPADLPGDSPLRDPARFEHRPVGETGAVLYIDRASSRLRDPPPPRAEDAPYPFQAVPEAGVGVFTAVLAVLAAYLAVGLAITGWRSLSLAFLVGVGAMSVYAVVLTWLRLPLCRWTLWFPALACAGFAAWRGRKETGDWKTRGLVLAAIAFPLAVGTLLAVGAPMDSGDDLSHWAIRAKVYYATGQVDTPEAAKGAFILNYYPPLVSTSLAWIYAGVGGVADGPAKLLFPAFMAAALGAMAHALRRTGLAPRHALLWAAIAALSGNELVLHAGWAWADLPLAAYVIAAVSLAVDRSFWWAGVCLGFCAFTKAEGMPTGLVLVAPLLVTLVWRRWLALGLPFALAAGIWGLHCRLYDYPVTREHIGVFEPSRLPAILQGLAMCFVSPWNWGIGPPIAIIGLVMAVAGRVKPAAYPTAVWTLHLLFLTLTYVITAVGHPIADQLKYTASRLLLHLWPVLLMAAALGWTPPPAKNGARAPFFI